MQKKTTPLPRGTVASSRLAGRTSRDIAGVMQRLQDEQESVQKRTFTKWINTHLAKRNPPMVVKDLFEDIKDGIVLIALLEVLSGQKLPCEQGRKLKRIHGVANIGTSLKFLEGRRIKLVNINSTDIADGRPSIVLGLVWTIILYFQIEELTSNLPQLQSLCSSTSSVDSVVSSETASPPSKRKVFTKVQGSAKKALLKWVQYTAARQSGIEVKDFGQSWRSGIAFHSVIHAICPELVDLEKAKTQSNKKNLEEAFTIAESELGIPRLLDPEDVDVDKPDEKSIMTYVAQFLKHYPDPHNTAGDAQEADVCFKLQCIIKLPDTILFEWHLYLDKSLPAPLGPIAAWLCRAETSLREDISIQQSHEETADTLHRKLEQHKDMLKNVDGYKRTFQEIRRAQSVNGVPIPLEQLDDMAERFNFVASSSDLHLLKMEFLELKYRLLSLLVLAESKLKSWIIKYGRRDSVELLLQNYMTVIENNKFFEQYEITYQILKKAAETYANANGSPEEIENITKFMNDTTTQWRHLSVEVRSVRSMLEEVISNWDRYSNTVAILQAWLEDAEKMLNQPEHAKKDFFRHLPQWIQQHTAMNDAGNFLIETCDETVSRDLKQQLLLLNGRWRELFMQVKQYARADELDRIKKEYLDGVAALSAFIDDVKRKIHTHLEVSFLNVKLFVQEMEDIKQKAFIMESQYKMITRTAQVVTKEIPQEEVNEMLTRMQRIKGQLSKVKETCPVVLFDSQELLPHLEELEKQITHFHESLDKINEIISVLDPEAQPAHVFKQQHQDLVAYQEHCKKALLLIERNSQIITKLLASSKVLNHFSFSVLQKKVVEIQAAFQDMVQKTSDWKKNVEVNSRLMKKFEESRTELENVLQTAQCCLKEKGKPEELLRKNTEFFSQLDQRVLNAFLKACDELTDILPEQEQHTLQEAVRKLHKQWKDLQSEAPYHLLRLKIEVEKSKFLAIVQECHTELTRQHELMTKESSEKIIKEHKMFFGDKGPLQLCEKRQQLIKELCLKLPEWDPIKMTSESSQKDLSELKTQVAQTYMKLIDQPDKWQEYMNRFSELRRWISSKETQLKTIKNGSADTTKYKQFKTSIEEIRQDACKKGETIIWLKSRLVALSEVSSENEVKKQGDELSVLASDFKKILALLTEIEKTLGAVGDCVQYTEEVKGTLEELITNSKEAQTEVEKILDVDNLLQAQQIFLYHQQKSKRLHAKRQDVQQQITHSKELQIEGGLSPAVQEDLWKLESTLESMQQSMEQRGDQLQEFLSETETGQHKLNLVVSKGELLSSILPKEKVKSIQTKIASAKEDWKKFISTLHQKETTLENLKVQMKDFETSAEPLQDWLNKTKEIVQSSNNNLHDLSTKRREHQNLQSVLEEIKYNEPQLSRLKEKAQQLWEEQAASKNFVHRVSQLSSLYLALSNLTKEKVSRMDRIVAEHQQFSHGLKELQDWMADTIQVLESYCCPTADKNALDNRMAKLEAILSLRQEKEIQMKMVVTRGESVLQNTSVEGTSVIEQQLKMLKDTWASLLSTCIHCKSQLEGALSKWTSYQDDVQQFTSWMNKVEAIMNASERQYSELREKKSSLSKSKLLKEEIFSHSTLLEAIEVKSTGMTEHYVTQLELQDLREKYQLLKDRIMETITKAEGYVHLHQEYQKNLKAFEVWLEKEQEKLNSLSHLEGDTERYEATLQELQELQVHCAEGQALLNATLHAREEVIPWGAPQLEERVLESLRQDWTVYQHKLSDVRIQLNTTLSRLKLMENKFLKMDQWLKTLEEKVNIRTSRQSDQATKEIQLQQLKNWHEEITVYKNEVEEIGLLAQHFLEEIHTSSRMGRQATQLASRYQTLVLHVLEQMKFLEEEIRSLEESELAFSAYKDWSEAILRQFRNVVTKCDVVERTLMEKKMQKLEDLMSDMDVGHSLLKSAREKGERAIKYIEENEAEQLKKQISDYVEQLDEMTCSIRKESTTIEKCLHLTKEFLDKYKIQTQWLTDYQIILHNTVDPKMELYEKKAQLSKYKTVQQTILSHEPLIKSVVEKGESLLELICDTNVAKNIQKLQNEYQELCNTAKMQVASLEEKVKQHEDYNSVLQEVEKWLLQMSSRLITPELMENSDLEVITQQLASHKATMEEIAGFEDRLNILKSKGDSLIKECAEHLQAKFKQNIETQLQGTRDSYSAICSTTKKVYQSLEHELQKHVNHQDTFQQCQAWLCTVCPELKANPHRPSSSADAIKQLCNTNIYYALLYLLNRSDAESTATHLEALKKLSVTLQDKRLALENLKEQRQKVTEHINLDDRELVKEQSGYFEQCWIQLEDQVKRKIQLSVTTLQELSVVQAKLQELMEWAEEQQPSISVALKHSPPPELAQNFLMDHLTLCSEVESKQLILKTLIKDADRVKTNLGLHERQMLQKSLSDAQNHVDFLSDLVWQKKRHLNKTLSDRTQFFLAALQAMNQIKQYEKKVICHEHISLLPEDVSKQIRSCKSTQASLKVYQSEVSGLWSQGRNLMKETTEEEKSEVLDKLHTLQNMYDTILQKCGQLLMDLERHVVSRKYFKEDLDKACHWLKQCDIVSFPEINLMNNNTELYSQLAKYQQILEEFPEYENLLLIVQKDGQEILPSLNEMDRSYLEEKLSALPQQFNMIIALAKDKFCKVQEAITARKEYASLLELTTRALSEVEDQLVNLRKTPSTLTAKEVVSLMEDYKNVLSEVISLCSAIDELNQKKEAFRSTGQPWLPEEMLTLATLYHKLKRQIEQKVNQLEDMMVAYQEHEEMCKQLEMKLNSIKEKEAEVNEETLPAEEKLKMYHFLAGSLQDSGILLKHIAEHLEGLSSQLDPSVHERADHQVRNWQEILKVLHTAIGDKVVECENRLVESIDFQTEICRSLDWLGHIKADLNEPLNMDVKLNSIQEEIRTVQIQQEEVQSSLRIMRALSNKEKEKYMKAKELVPVDLENSLTELSERNSEVQEAIQKRQENLSKLYSLCQRYYQVSQTANNWLEDAQVLLQFAQNGLDTENSEENLRNHIEFFNTEKQFQLHLKEVKMLVSDMEPFIQTLRKEDLEEKVRALEDKSIEIEQEEQCQKELLQRCVSQWQDYQIARQHIIDLMNESEKKLSEFSVAKTSSQLGAEEKIVSHKSLVSTVNSFHETITSLEEKASMLEKMGNISSKATISRSMTTVWQRWTRLRSIAQEQERILEESVQKWNVFDDKMQKATETLDQLHERLPESSVEKASKNELQDLLDYHSNFILELEQQLSSLGLLKQHSFSLLQDIEITPSSQEQMPIMQEIKAMQDRCHNMQQKVKKSEKVVKQELKEREEVEKEINKVKTWIQEGREYLLNPTIESDTQVEKLQTLLNDATMHRQAVEKMAEQQQNKYLGLYTILPSELSLQLAEAGLALVNIHEQIEAKVKEAQQHKTLNQEFNHKIQDVAKELDLIQLKLKEKTNNITQAKRDQKNLDEELDSCNIKLLELEAAVQSFAEQNPQLGKQLTGKINKLTEFHQQIIREAEYRASKLNQAVSHLDEYNEMLEFTLKWIEKAKILLHGNIMWNSATILRNQFMSHQTMFEEAGELPRDLETMNEKTEYLASVYFTEEMFQQVSDLRRQTEDLQQAIKQRLQNIQDAAKDMKKFETEVKALRTALEQAQATLTSPEIGRLSLKEQLSHRQHLLLEMESLKPKVHAVQVCQSALRIPEEVLTTLPICHAALRLQEDASHLQHTAIQQCNIMQCGFSQELAEKIKGYQEQIASLNSKCKMLTMKAKHATMLLTVTEVEGLSERMEELDSEDMLPALSAHPSVMMMTAGRCHTLLSPVTEESGEEGSNSEISSPPACRSPSPVANADASVNQDIAYYQALSAEQLQTEASQIQPSTPIVQESYEPRLEALSSTKLDDLQRSWETLKNVISEKQRTLYEALERQQKYQDSLQSISTKMEAVEVKLNDTLDSNKSPESQMAGHQALMDEILMLQEEISELQISLAEELVSEPLEADAAEQLALQSTLTVLAERMATIKMKASGKQQLLEEKLNEQLEEQRQEQALQRFRSEADELDHWLLNTQASLSTTLVTDEEPMDMDSQLVDCQNMLMEIEQKVVTLSELSVHNENLLMEGKAQTKDEAEQLALKLRTLKGSLLELQRVLHDKQINIQGAVQEMEECKSDLVTSQDPSIQEWLAQAQTTRSQQQLSILQRQKELEKELAEQKSLLHSVASRGEEILTQSFSDMPYSSKNPDKLTEELSLEGEKPSSEDQMKMKWESLNQEFSIKHRLLQNALEQEQDQSVSNLLELFLSFFI
ncbi:PREDICTED: nesprin-1-like [Thamnophis sirtalis]|uniref:Nesprin-1-like n=1 Tax=Thamnophis sirtalis TaxID=35019 RepID=A0A6I9XB88_9SAUR|nr:PREDICTED: nesprin-1-like [Thamnophis sirtalis]